MTVKRSPLEGRMIGNVATVAIRELPGIHMIDLRVAPGSSSHAAVAETLGISLTGKPGQAEVSTGRDHVHSLCLAPDWWLIIGMQEVKQKLAPLLMQDNYHLNVVDVSGQRTVIELEGPNVRGVLSHLLELDLREKGFPVGSVAQSLMANAPVIVYHIAAFRYHVMVRSSFALHLWKALVDAAEEWM
jgi:heterotetrameric sarcosine oxidase gamma subunit